MPPIGYFLLLLFCISTNIIDGMDISMLEAKRQLSNPYLPDLSIINQKDNPGSDTEEFLEREGIYALFNHIVTVDKKKPYAKKKSGNMTEFIDKHTQPQQSIPQNFLTGDKHNIVSEREYFSSSESCDTDDEFEEKRQLSMIHFPYPITNDNNSWGWGNPAQSNTFDFYSASIDIDNQSSFDKADNPYQVDTTQNTTSLLQKFVPTTKKRESALFDDKLSAVSDQELDNKEIPISEQRPKKRQCLHSPQRHLKIPDPFKKTNTFQQTSDPSRQQTEKQQKNCKIKINSDHSIETTSKIEKFLTTTTSKKETLRIKTGYRITMSSSFGKKFVSLSHKNPDYPIVTVTEKKFYATTQSTSMTKFIDKHTQPQQSIPQSLLERALRSLPTDDECSTVDDQEPLILEQPSSKQPPRKKKKC